MKFDRFVTHFIKNRNHFQDLDWSNAVLTLEEKNIILSSLQQFQKGESSEGKHLMQFADELGQEDYTQAVIGFIKEEQVHAMILEKFMDQNNIPRISHHWVDSVFRFLRKIFSLENSVAVLLTAEIIAAIYYDALGKTTNSQTLQLICKQILVDEAVHIDFQSITLREFYINHNWVGKKMARMHHKILMIFTILVVWLYHRRVLIHGGYSLKRFYYSIMQKFRRSEKMIIRM